MANINATRTLVVDAPQVKPPPEAEVAPDSVVKRSAESFKVAVDYQIKLVTPKARMFIFNTAIIVAVLLVWFLVVSMNTDAGDDTRNVIASVLSPNIFSKVSDNFRYAHFFSFVMIVVLLFFATMRCASYPTPLEMKCSALVC